MQLPFNPYVVDDDDSDDDAESVIDEGSSWARLPSTALERVFAHLPQRDRYAAALVCLSWAEAFWAPRVWRRMKVGPGSFTCKKMRFRRTSRGNGRYQKTRIQEQKVDSPQLFQEALSSVGRYLYSLQFHPMTDYRKLMELLSVLDPQATSGASLEDSLENVIEDEVVQTPELVSLKTFAFRFAFSIMDTAYEGIKVLGTGGVILDSLRSSIPTFGKLERVVLEDLFLDAEDGDGVLDFLVHCPRLRHLEAFNLTNEAATTIDLLKFPNLETLLVSPLQVTETLLTSLPAATNLRHLRVVVDEFSGLHIPAFERQIWNRVRDKKSDLQLGIATRGRFTGNLPVLTHGPVTDIVFDSPASEISLDSIKPVVDCYASTLKIYGHVHVPSNRGSKASAERVHAALDALCAACPRLKTLGVKDMIYSSTILYIVKKYPSLRNFHVRRKGVMYKNAFSPVSDRSLTSAEHRFLREHSRSLDSLKRGLDSIVPGQWSPMSDRAFRAAFD